MEGTHLRRLVAYVPSPVYDAVTDLTARTGLSRSRVAADAVTAYVGLHGLVPEPDAPPFAHLDVHLTAGQYAAITDLASFSGADASIIIGMLIDRVLNDPVVAVES